LIGLLSLIYLNILLLEEPILSKELSVFLPPRVEIPDKAPPPLHCLIVLVSSGCSVDDYLENIVIGSNHYWHIFCDLYILLVLNLAFNSYLQICQHLPIWLSQPLSAHLLAFDE
jgi:hypothetical protein